MFNNLRKFSSDPLKPELSQVIADSTIPSLTPSQPPSRFGATRIVIAKDPERSTISIYELRNDVNQNDYVVYIFDLIRHESTYYAELVTLLRTVTSDSRINIYIGSRGGCLYTGAMIANAIQKSKAHVTTVAVGLVASAAALIWSYGHSRSVSDGAVLMFHMSSHFEFGNSKEIQIAAENTVRYVKEVAIDPLVAEGFLTPDEAETIIDRRRDVWLDSTTVMSRLEVVHAKHI